MTPPDSDAVCGECGAKKGPWYPYCTKAGEFGVHVSKPDSDAREVPPPKPNCRGKYVSDRTWEVGPIVFLPLLLAQNTFAMLDDNEEVFVGLADEWAKEACVAVDQDSQASVTLPLHLAQRILAALEDAESYARSRSFAAADSLKSVAAELRAVIGK